MNSLRLMTRNTRAAKSLDRAKTSFQDGEPFAVAAHLRPFPLPSQRRRRTTAKPHRTQPTNRPPPPRTVEPAQPRPHSEACRGLLRPAEGLLAPGGRCGTSSRPGSPPSARRSSRCSAARSPPPPDPGTTQYPRPPLPSRPTSRRTGPPSTRPPARTPPRSSAPGIGGRPWSFPSSGSATSTPPSSPPFSDRYRLRRGSSPPPTASTAESAPPSPSSPTTSATPRRSSPPPRWLAGPTWRPSWRSSRTSPSRLIGSVEAFCRSWLLQPVGTRRRSSSKLCRASCSPCTTRRCSAASTIVAPRLASLGDTRRGSNGRGRSEETKPRFPH